MNETTVPLIKVPFAVYGFPTLAVDFNRLVVVRYRMHLET